MVHMTVFIQTQPSSPLRMSVAVLLHEWWQRESLNRCKQREMMCQSLNPKPPTAGSQPEGNLDPLMMHIQLSDGHLAHSILWWAAYTSRVSFAYLNECHSWLFPHSWLKIIFRIFFACPGIRNLAERQSIASQDIRCMFSHHREYKQQSGAIFTGL